MFYLQKKTAEVNYYVLYSLNIIHYISDKTGLVIAALDVRAPV